MASSSAAAAKVAEQRTTEIRKIRSTEPNKTCFNCQERSPNHLVFPYAIFVCMQCAGLHREYNHRVKSLSTSTFDENEVNLVRKGGNDGAREHWLARHKGNADSLLPNQSDPADVRVQKLRDFIRLTFIEKRWAKRTPEEEEAERQKERERLAREKEKEKELERIKAKEEKEKERRKLQKLKEKEAAAEKVKKVAKLKEEKEKSTVVEKPAKKSSKEKEKKRKHKKKVESSSEESSEEEEEEPEEEEESSSSSSEEEIIIVRRKKNKPKKEKEVSSKASKKDRIASFLPLAPPPGDATRPSSSSSVSPIPIAVKPQPTVDLLQNFPEATSAATVYAAVANHAHVAEVDEWADFAGSPHVVASSNPQLKPKSQQSTANDDLDFAGEWSTFSSSASGSAPPPSRAPHVSSNEVDILSQSQPAHNNHVASNTSLTPPTVPTQLETKKLSPKPKAYDDPFAGLDDDGLQPSSPLPDLSPSPLPPQSHNDSRSSTASAPASVQSILPSMGGLSLHSDASGHNQVSAAPQAITPSMSNSVPSNMTPMQSFPSMGPGIPGMPNGTPSMQGQAMQVGATNLAGMPGMVGVGGNQQMTPEQAAAYQQQIMALYQQQMYLQQLMLQQRYLAQQQMLAANGAGSLPSTATSMMGMNGPVPASASSSNASSSTSTTASSTAPPGKSNYDMLAELMK